MHVWLPSADPGKVWGAHPYPERLRTERPRMEAHFSFATLHGGAWTDF